METKISTALNAIIFFLIGFLAASVLSDTPIRATDVSSTIVAIAAAYGVLKWREQHDYQREKNDKKELIKLIKEMAFYLTETHVSISVLNANIISYSKNRNQGGDSEFSERLVKRSLKRLEDRNERLGEIHSQIEAELTTNYITENNEELQTQILCVIIRAEEFIASANSMISVCQGFELLDTEDHEDQMEIEEMVTSELLKFLLEISKVEIMLGIQLTTLARAKGKKRLEDFDQAIERQKTDQASE